MNLVKVGEETNPEVTEDTHHHHEWRNPGGSPNVMFFSHRIWTEGGDAGHFQPALRGLCVQVHRLRTNNQWL